MIECIYNEDYNIINKKVNDMKKVFSHLKWFFKANKYKYLLVFIVLVVMSILGMLPTRFLGLAIDLIVEGRLTTTSLVLLAAGLFGIPLIRYLLNIIYHYNINKLGHSLLFALREKYISHLFALDNETYEKYTKGDLISRATRDLNNLNIFATSFLQVIVFNIGLILTAIILMFFINPLLTIASITFMPIAIFYLNKKRLKKREYYKTHHEIYAQMAESVLESIEGVKTVRSYHHEEDDFAKTKVAIDNDVNSWHKIMRFEAMYQPLFELIYAVCYFIAIALGSYMVIHSKITTGSLVTFLMYVGMLYAPLINLSNTINNINNIVISDQRYFEIMDIVPNVKDAEGAQSIIKFNKIVFQNVTFRYPFDNFDTISDINLTIKSGQTIGIVGPSGSGKSTLIRQFLREFNVSSGRILIDDKNIEDYRVEDIHNLVGYVPQDHILFRRKVEDNILIGNPRATIEKINQAMVIADFQKDLSSLPQGILTEVSEMGGSLSGGQRQRLSIARALVKDPEILILDDSLSAVDALTEANIIGHLKEERQNKTNIIVAHRFSAIKDSDKIIVVNKGRISDVGTHAQLLKYDNWYKREYLKQIGSTNAGGENDD